MLQAAIDESQRAVTGTARLKLYKGSVSVAGRKAAALALRPEDRELRSRRRLPPGRRRRLHPAVGAPPAHPGAGRKARAPSSHKRPRRGAAQARSRGKAASRPRRRRSSRRSRPRSASTAALPLRHRRQRSRTAACWSRAASSRARDGKQHRARPRRDRARDRRPARFASDACRRGHPHGDRAPADRADRAGSAASCTPRRSRNDQVALDLRLCRARRDRRDLEATSRRSSRR